MSTTLPCAIVLQAPSMSCGISSVLAKSLAVPRGRRPRTLSWCARKSTTELTDPSPPPRIRNLKAVEGLEERALPAAGTRVDDQGRTLGRNVTAHTKSSRSLVVGSAEILRQWISACAGMTREEAAMTNALILGARGMRSP